MLFNSLSFVLFFLVVYLGYTILNRKGQNLLLLVASYFFYSCWDWRFLFLIIISTVVDYLCGIAIHRSREMRIRKLFLLISICTNLGILFFFKYYGFFVESARAALMGFGVPMDLSALSFLLPVGISFYTFQTMSYTIDVYRGQMRPCLSVLDFSLYVAFFPQLVAGPIERATHLLPQFQNKRTIDYAGFREGCWLVLFGFFKKVVVADNMAPFVNAVFDDPATAYGLAIPVAVVAFAFQIYGDFSGYSDIARGISKLMGFDLMLNFRMPYFSLNPREFWQRWHISLSTWLRDYLYIPLGGSRRGTVRTHINLMLTMLLGGLWHGAAWNFVLWGVYQGTLLIAYRMFADKAIGRLRGRPKSLGFFLRLFVFFICTCFGWLLFRANSLQDVITLIVHASSGFCLNGLVGVATILCFVTPLLFIDIIQERASDMLAVKNWPCMARLSCYSLMVISIICCGWVDRIEFIYFQF